MRNAPQSRHYCISTVLICSILALFIIAGCSSPSLTDLEGTLLDPPMELDRFTFQTADQPLPISELSGKYVILAFGYTYCPDACPTTMARLAKAVSELDENELAQTQVVLISVDPERDTLEKLKLYTAGFNPQFIGATLEPAVQAPLFKTLGIFHERADSTSTTDYLVDHTTSTVVLDKAGNWRLVWNFEVSSSEMAADLKKLIAYE